MQSVIQPCRKANLFIAFFSNGHTRMKGKKPPIRYVNYEMGDNSAQFQSLHIAIHGVEFVCTRREVLLGRMKWDEWQTCEREVAWPVAA